jgi:hypothetical protein
VRGGALAGLVQGLAAGPSEGWPGDVHAGRTSGGGLGLSVSGGFGAGYACVEVRRRGWSGGGRQVRPKDGRGTSLQAEAAVVVRGLSVPGRFGRDLCLRGRPTVLGGDRGFVDAGPGVVHRGPWGGEGASRVGAWLNQDWQCSPRSVRRLLRA